MLDGVILKGTCVVVTQTMHKKVLTLIHEGNMGITKCRLWVCSCVFWPRLNSQIEWIVNERPECSHDQLSKGRFETLRPLKTPSAWHTIVVDLFEHEGQPYLLLTDYLLHFLMVKCLNDQTSSCAYTV